MRVAVYHSNSDVRVEDRPVPAIGSAEILVHIRASGICGSDVMEWYRVPKAPLVLGHEVSGDIVEVGADVHHLAAGQRVVVSHHVPCNTCALCLAGAHTACHTLHTTNFDPGGFSEFVRVPPLQTERGVLVLPDDVTYEEGTFVEPLGCVVRAQERAGVRPGSTVLVIGSGISGLLHIRLAFALGAGRVVATDVSDLVILCTSALPAIQQGLACLESGATFIFFAPPPPGEPLALPMTELWRREVTVRTSYGAAPADLATALGIIASRRVAVADLVTHRIPLDDIEHGFALVAGADESVKVIVEP